MLLARRTQDLMPSLFNELLNWNNWTGEVMSDTKSMPKMNVTESDNDYKLELCVPGLKKEDLSLTIDADNNLVIEMVSKEEKEETNTAERHYLRKEFSRMQFKQMIRIPA